LTPCAICGRQAHGFGYCHHLRWDRFPHHRFCSSTCFKAGAALARRNNGMIDKSQFEKQAIKDARRNFAEALTALGLMAPFFERSAADIDRLIEACVDGFQESMQRQAAEQKARDDELNDDVPF
jgi:hypothetical protein